MSKLNASGISLVLFCVCILLNIISLFIDILIIEVYDLSISQMCRDHWYVSLFVLLPQFVQVIALAGHIYL